MLHFTPNLIVDPSIADSKYPVTVPCYVYQTYPSYPEYLDYFGNYSNEQSIFTSINIQDHAYRQYRMQATIKNLQLFFSFANVLTDFHIQRMMSRSLWVSLEQVLDTWLYYLEINYEQLQEYAIWKMYRLDTNFELDTTRTLIRPSWAKSSYINFRVNHCFKASEEERVASAKRILREALESVAESQQIAHENKKVEITLFGQESDQSFTASFNAPGIPSLILSFTSGYSEGGVKVEVTEILDSVLLPREYPALKIDDEKQLRNGEMSPVSVKCVVEENY